MDLGIYSMQNVTIEQHSRKGKPYSYTVSRGDRILLITTSKRVAFDYAERCKQSAEKRRVNAE